MKHRYDVLILGGGNAGLGVTVPTRAAGLSVAVVEFGELGGTCPNRGCTPKKVLVAAAHALDEIERAAGHCISVANPKLNWAALIGREKQMIGHIPEALARVMAERGVEVIRGRAKFAGPDAVTVGDHTIAARHIVIATGSKPRPLPIDGACHISTSDEMLTDPELPPQVVFIGGGVTALEFGHVYAHAGAEVTILELAARLLPALDEDMADLLRDHSERVGIRVHTGVTVQAIRLLDDKLQVTFLQNGRQFEVAADRVVNGAGRVANVDTLDLEVGNVAHSNGRILVDPHLRSVSNPAVHVCGDVLWSSPQLSPLATYEGRLVGRNIVEGHAHKPDYAGVPSCVYTIPAAASVGLTETQARQDGAAIQVHVNNMRDWLSVRTFNQTVAWAKVIVDEASDRILGAHLLGHGGEELIHLFAFAIKFGITAGQIRDTVFAFPTYSADIKSMV